MSVSMPIPRMKLLCMKVMTRHSTRFLKLANKRLDRMPLICLWIAPLGSGQDGYVIVGLCRSRQKTLPERMIRSEEHTTELQSLMRISYAVFCMTNKHTRTQLWKATDIHQWTGTHPLNLR